MAAAMTAELKERLRAYAVAKRAKTTLLKDVTPDLIAILADFYPEQATEDERQDTRAAYLSRASKEQLDGLAGCLDRFYVRKAWASSRIGPRQVTCFPCGILRFVLKSAGVSDPGKYLRVFRCDFTAFPAFPLARAAGK